MSKKAESVARQLSSFALGACSPRGLSFIVVVIDHEAHESTVQSNLSLEAQRETFAKVLRDEVIIETKAERL